MNHVTMVDDRRADAKSYLKSTVMSAGMIALLGAMVAATGCVGAVESDPDALATVQAEGELERTGEAEQALDTSPLTASQFTCISSSCSRTMSTDATLQRGGDFAGQLFARTLTKNTVKLSGFTGGVFIVLRNADGAVVGVSDLHTYGVDGKWIGTYIRDEIWIENFDPQVAAATTQMDIVQQWASQDRIGDILGQIQVYKEEGCAIINVPGVCS